MNNLHLPSLGSASLRAVRSRTLLTSLGYASLRAVRLRTLLTSLGSASLRAVRLQTLPVWFLAACSLGGPAPATDPDAVFPHQAEYQSGAIHGADALRVGTEACATCHGSTSTAPTCASCHETWPHDSSWLVSHGEGLTKDTLTPCLACHDVAGSAAQNQANCKSCHPSWPHPEGWDVLHGPYTLDRGSAKATCGSCHGADLHGVGDAPSCTSCHPSWPHPSDWLVAHREAAHQDLAACAECHGAPTDGGAAGVSCDRCHLGYPHVADFAKTHLDAAALGEGACLACHEPGDGPSTMVATCAEKCHGGAQ